jgi:hypothetical protein
MTFPNLITDRTAEDVQYVSALAAKIKANTATEAEQEEWNGAALKGAYCYTDLNRVGSAISYLAGLLRDAGYKVSVTPKTDWQENEWLTPETAAQYLADVAELRKQFALYATTPTVPDGMVDFGYAQANDIERILTDINTLLENALAQVVYCGEVYAGEV